jgi:hypothetical protein
MKMQQSVVMYPVLKGGACPCLSATGAETPGTSGGAPVCWRTSPGRMTEESATPPPNGYGDDRRSSAPRLTREDAGTIQTRDRLLLHLTLPGVAGT